MGLEVLVALVAAAAASLLTVPLVERLLDRYENTATLRLLERLGLVELTDTTSFQAKIKKSLSALSNATREVDETVLAITKLATQREQTLSRLEAQLGELTTRESELKNKIQTLEQVPIEAIRHFEEVLNKGDRRSAYRDYMLFGAGVIVSTIIAILLKWFGM